MIKIIISAALISMLLTPVFANGEAENVTESAVSEEEIMAELPDHLVDSEWLNANADADNLVILDTARSAEDFNAGHISGAVYADRAKFWAEVDGIPGMFPGVEKTVSWLEDQGISNDKAVVVYDAGPGLWAARVAWTLAYLGHDNWAVLNGGYAYWVDEDYPTVSGKSAKREKGSFTVNLRPKLLASSDQILEHMNDPDFVIVDTRSPGEYSGEDVRGARGGHIPGALPIEWTLNNSGSPATLLPTDQLAEFYVSEGVESSDQIVTLCQTGVRGAHTWLALTLAGYKDVALYDGSWAEWSANDAYPVE